MNVTKTQEYPLPVSDMTPGPGQKTMSMDLVPMTSAPGPTSETQQPAAVPVQPEASSITKEQLKDHLRQWVRVENEISALTAEIKKRKLIHQQLSASLLSVMRQNEIDCFDIANGRIVYSKTKVRAPLNNGQLKSALTKYYKDDAEKANSLTEFLLSSRVEKTRESIKMKIPKIK
jgi:hypothetical protein